MKSFFLVGFAALTASLAGASPLGTRGACEADQFKGGNLCCMVCGCSTLETASCYYCLQNCLCGNNFTYCPLH